MRIFQQIKRGTEINRGILVENKKSKSKVHKFEVLKQTNKKFVGSFSEKNNLKGFKT